MPPPRSISLCWKNIQDVVSARGSVSLLETLAIFPTAVVNDFLSAGDSIFYPTKPGCRDCQIRSKSFRSHGQSLVFGDVQLLFFGSPSPVNQVIAGGCFS